MGVSKITRFVLFLSLCVFATTSAFIDTVQRNVKEKTSVYISADNKEPIRQSINSSVRIISSRYSIENFDGTTSTSSGVYFVNENINYVLTTAHSLIGECENTFIIADDLMYNCVEIIYLNQNKDMGIMEVEQIYNRNPLKIVDFLCLDNELKYNIGVHENIVYTGYPQGHGPFTFNGKIVSHKQENGTIYALSYAWAGSSGSAVFNSKGKLVGIVTAVTVANTEYGVDVMEDLIIIKPITKWELLAAL